MHEAKSQLLKLGKLAWQGEEVIIAKAGEPWLRLTPYREHRQERKMGGLEDQFWMSPDFDDEDEELIQGIEASTTFPREKQWDTHHAIGRASHEPEYGEKQ